ncbi:MAG TPA: hypothetical protein VFC07_03415, partial [Verrucomicrobiae bacterium]|nr:hypothetical protein [Verrucomicrobiae bacterium]
EFYRSVLTLEQGGVAEFQNSMRKLSDANQPEWQDERNVFTVRIWCEEFFIARYEAATVKENPRA